MMKYKDLKAMPAKELQSKLAELKMELLKENAQIANKTSPKNPGKVRQAKKTIARIHMALHMEGKNKT